jgi:hypothetical protein
MTTMVKSRRRRHRRRNDKRKSLRKRGGVRNRSRSRSRPGPVYAPDRHIDKLKHFYVKKLQKYNGSFEPGELTQAHFKFSDSLYGNEIPVEVEDIRSMINEQSLFYSDPIHPDKYKGVVFLMVGGGEPYSLQLQKQNDSGEYVRDFINYRIDVNPNMTPEERSSTNELGLQHQLSFVP